MKRHTKAFASGPAAAAATSHPAERRSPRWRKHLFDAGVGLAYIAQRIAIGLAHAAVGALDGAGFRERTTPEHQTYRLAAGEILSGLFWWEANVYAKYIGGEDRILVVGAGTGRDVIALAAAGHDVVGLEPFPELLAIAREHLDACGLSATLIAGAIGGNSVLPGRFDAIIFSDNMYSVLPLSAKRVAALTQAREHLTPGGRVIVSYFGATEVLPQRAHRIARLAAWLTRSDLRLERSDVVRTRGPRERQLHYHHVFTAPEIEAEAQLAGLRVVFHRHPPDFPTIVLTA